MVRIDSEHERMAMPLWYSAPEVILGMNWGHLWICILRRLEIDLPTERC